MSNSNAGIKSGKLWTETLVNYPLKSVVNYGVKYPDDFGIQPLDAQNQAILMDIIERSPWQTLNPVYSTGTGK